LKSAAPPAILRHNRSRPVPFEFGKTVQIAAAALGIPAGAAGTYSVYQTFFTNDLACQRLRASIVATMEKSVAPEAKRTLMRRDVGEFVTKCGAEDPDARTLFEAALKEDRPALAMATSAAAATPAGGATQQGLPKTADVFGRSERGEVRGWVALTRGEPARLGEPNFEGYAISLTVLPPVDTVLRARETMPVWREPQQRGANDESKLQGRVPAQTCVRVVATRPAEGKTRTWGEVVPVTCPPTRG
jgi:hypothetical protein